MGDWLSTVAVVLSLYHVTGAAGPAIYMAARVIPRPLGAWCGGRACDRLGPRAWLLLSTAVQLFCTVVMAGAIVAASAALLIAAVIAAQLAGAATIPARTHLIAHLGDEQLRTRTMGLNSTLASLAMVIAPPAGAVLLLAVPPAALVAADAATFVAALTLFRMSRARFALVQNGARSEGGYTLLFRSRALRRLTFACTGNFAVVTVLQALLVSVAHDHLGSTGVLGYLYGAVGAGSVAGGLLASRRRPGRVLPALVVIECITAVIAATVTSVAAAVVVLAVCGAAGTAYQVGGSLLLIDEAGREHAGSVSGALTSVCYAGMASGALLATIAAPLGPSLVTLTAAIALAAGVATGLAETAVGLSRRSKRDHHMRFGNDATAVHSTLVQDHP